MSRKPNPLPLVTHFYSNTIILGVNASNLITLTLHGFMIGSFLLDKFTY